MTERTGIDWEAARRRIAVAEAALTQALHPDAQRVASVRRERATRLAAPPQATAGAVALLRFRVGGQPFALPLSETAQVVSLAGCVPEPGAPAETLGLVQVRGDICVVLDGRRLLGPGQDRGDLAPPCAVLLRAGGGRVGLAVDRVEGIAAVPVDHLRPVASGFARTGLVRSVTADGTAVVDAAAVAHCAAAPTERQTP